MLLSFGASRVNAQASDWTAINTALGRSGAAQPGDVMKYSFPRSDLHVVVDGITLKPALALGTWVAFMGNGQNATAMGDLVLTEDEIGPVMTKLQSGGVEQTALHNHLLHESPHVMYMHINAHGDARAIAHTIHDALALTHTPMSATAAATPLPIELDTTGLANALGYKGKVNGGVYQVSVPRAEKVMENGMEVPPSMGTATAINFQPTGGGKAVISGDFVMTDVEVNRVIRTLQQSHIQPTAIHSHMLGESPKLYFMHFWASDDALSLARGVAAALNQMNVQPARP